MSASLARLPEAGHRGPPGCKMPLTSWLWAVLLPGTLHGARCFFQRQEGEQQTSRRHADKECFWAPACNTADSVTDDLARANVAHQFCVTVSRETTRA